MRKVIKLARSLTSAEVEACRSISYRGDGMMMSRISDARRVSCNRSIVVMYWEKTKLAAWGILGYVWKDRHTRMYLQHKVPEAHFYTREEFRGQGLARKIFDYFHLIAPISKRYNDAAAWVA